MAADGGGSEAQQVTELRGADRPVLQHGAQDTVPGALVRVGSGHVRADVDGRNEPAAPAGASDPVRGAESRVLMEYTTQSCRNLLPRTSKARLTYSHIRARGRAYYIA